MSTPSQDRAGDPAEGEPGAVRVDPETVPTADAELRQEAAAQAETETQAARVEAEARAEEIQAEVARTDARRAEEDAAEAEQAVKRAEAERARAEQEQREAQERADRVAEDADQARERAANAGAPTHVVAARSRGFTERPSGEPIVFGPFTAERPELLVVAAFVGGLVLARIVRGIAS